MASYWQQSFAAGRDASIVGQSQFEGVLPKAGRPGAKEGLSAVLMSDLAIECLRGPQPCGAACGVDAKQ